MNIWVHSGVLDGLTIRQYQCSVLFCFRRNILFLLSGCPVLRGCVRGKVTVDQFLDQHLADKDIESEHVDRSATERPDPAWKYLSPIGSRMDWIS